MENDQIDVRWQQRFQNYQKALNQLRKFIEKGELNALEQQGLIKAFEYTYELAWKVMKDYYEDQGEIGIQGSRDAIRLAFQRGLIEAGDEWMMMIKSRVNSV
ncbi:MAG: HI0074 family nucleotidyltransferase substrate-binding subunit, partial [Prochlorotrichaceae cyanobacterium]